MENGPPSGAADAGARRGRVDVLFEWVRRVNRWTHWIAGAAMVGLMVLTVIDVVGRRFFDRPFPGTVELTQMALILIIYLGFAYAEHNDDHISVDIVYSRLRRGIQLVLGVVTSVFGIALIGLLAYRLYVYSGVLDGGGYTTPTRGIPLAPFALVAVAGAVLFALALLVSAIDPLRRLRDENR